MGGWGSLAAYKLGPVKGSQEEHNGKPGVGVRTPVLGRLLLTCSPSQELPSLPVSPAVSAPPLQSSAMSCPMNWVGTAQSRGRHGGGDQRGSVCRLIPSPCLLSFTGDFAVLLQAGLSFRRLLLLSLVSGALGLGGAALGVGLSVGPMPLTPWVFGVTAGVFLYVALVDMVRGVG